MARLPPHHVPRPRLTEPCRDARLVVVEAAGGFGKTVFAAELVDLWRAVGIEVQLDHDATPASLLAARLHAALRRAGYTEAASAAAEAGEDVIGGVDAALDALRGEQCAVVVDDAHFATPDAAALLCHVGERLTDGLRLVVLARALPKGAERLRRAEATCVGSADLALRPDETLAVCVQGFGLAVSTAGATALDDATGGWTAATALAAARARRTGEDPATVARAAKGEPDAAVRTILAEPLGVLGSAGRAALAQAARLPLLDADVVDAAADEAGFFSRALSAGIPFTPSRGAWFDLPGPVRDHLASLAPVAPEALRAVAAHYACRDELGEALQLLVAAGDTVGAAGVLAATELETLESLDALEMRAVVDAFGPAAFAAHPTVLLIAARSCEVAALLAQRADFLEQARTIADAGDDEAFRRAVDVEEASDAMRDLQYKHAESEARRVLAAVGPDEGLTCARAESVVGRALCWRTDDAGRRDFSVLDDASRHLARAGERYAALGMRSAAAGLVPYSAMWVEFAGGRAEAALARLDEALSLTEDRPRRRAHLLSYRAEVLIELGRYDEFELNVAALLEAGDRLSNVQLHAYAHWCLAAAASYRGDAAGTLAELRLVEANKGDWWGPAGPDFLAEAVSFLDRVGEATLAREYLERVAADPRDAEHLVLFAEASLEARHGDPERGLELFAIAEQRQVDPREHWRMMLLCAFARFRMGEHAAAGALAAAAFEEAAALGQPDAPMIRERSLTDELLALAVQTGKPASLALQASTRPVSLSVLGRFELTVAGRAVPLPSGRGAQLVKLVAVAGGPVAVERVIETVWPDVEVEAGRNRLRTNLSRLRDAAGDVLVRDGDQLALAAEVRLDLRAFESEAARAMALRGGDPAVASSVARGAIARYRGDLLPDDPYEDWATAPRERARRTLLDLLDLCAEEAERRGDLDEVRRLVERTIEAAPHDDTRYLRAATTLLEQGRRGEALSIVHRARGAFAEIGLDAPEALLALERSILA